MAGTLGTEQLSRERLVTRRPQPTGTNANSRCYLLVTILIFKMTLWGSESCSKFAGEETRDSEGRTTGPVPQRARELSPACLPPSSGL